MPKCLMNYISCLASTDFIVNFREGIEMKLFIKIPNVHTIVYY